MERSFDGTDPEVAASAYVDDAAVLVGDVSVGPEASVWPNATLRGDSGEIRVRERASVQDNAVLHGSVLVNRKAAVGHGGVVHDARIGEAALVGMNAVVLDDAEIGERAIVAAGAVVTEETTVPPEMLVAGRPAEPKRELDGDETDARAVYYADLAAQYRTGNE